MKNILIPILALILCFGVMMFSINQIIKLAKEPSCPVWTIK